MERRRYYDNDEYICADAGWRAPLSIVLKNVKNKDERIKLLDDFFVFWDEYVHK